MLQSQLQEGSYRYLADPRVEPPHLRNAECSTEEDEVGCQWDWCESQVKLAN
jgi:hypothetical protein